MLLPSGALLAHAGIDQITALPVDRFETVHDVLDGVAALLNECVQRARTTFTGESAQPPVPLQIVPIRDLRAAIAENGHVPDVARRLVATTSDNAIAEALLASWAVVERRFLAIREEVIADVHRRLLLGSQAAESIPDSEQEAHHIEIAVYSERLAVSWPDGTTSTVSQDDAATAEFYDGLCDALDAIEMNCPFHEGDQRDTSSCTCGEPTVAEGV